VEPINFDDDTNVLQKLNFWKKIEKFIVLFDLPKIFSISGQQNNIRHYLMLESNLDLPTVKLTRSSPHHRKL